MQIKNQHVRRLEVSQHTGCLHYNSTFDVISIKCKDCNQYYACYECHIALADHPFGRWHPEEFDTKAILCGRCSAEMTIEQYLSCNSLCMYCKTSLNPNCKTHWSLYFVL